MQTRNSNRILTFSHVNLAKSDFFVQVIKSNLLCGWQLYRLF